MHLLPYFVWGNQVVRVKPLDVVALRQGQALISCCARTCIGLGDNLDARRFKGPGQRERLVSGTIVNDDQLFIRPRLSRHRLDRVGDPTLSVVGWNEN